MLKRYLTKNAALVGVFIVLSMHSMHVLAQPTPTSDQSSLEALKTQSAHLGVADRAKADKLLSVALSLWQSGDYAAAAIGLKQTLDIDPANPKANFYYGDSLMRGHDKAQAKIYLERAVALGSDTVEGMKAQARLAELGKPGTYEDLSPGEITNAYLGVWTVSVSQYFKDFELTISSISDGMVTVDGRQQHVCIAGGMSFKEGSLTNGHLRLKGRGACSGSPVFELDLVDQNTMVGTEVWADGPIQATLRRKSPYTGVAFVRQNPPTGNYGNGGSSSGSISPLNQMLMNHVMSQYMKGPVTPVTIPVAPPSQAAGGTYFPALSAQEEQLGVGAARGYDQRCAGRTLTGAFIGECNQLLGMVRANASQQTTMSTTSRPVVTTAQGGAIPTSAPARSTPEASPVIHRPSYTSSDTWVAGSEGAMNYKVIVQNTGDVNLQCFVHLTAMRWKVGSGVAATSIQSKFTDTETVTPFVNSSDSATWTAIVPGSPGYTVDCQPRH